MNGPPYSITQRSPDALDYDEGDGRLITLDLISSLKPPQVSVPSAREWVRRTPVWAHGQRDMIIDRLRRSGTVVAEADDEATLVVSPDGRFLVDSIIEVSNRGWRHVRISALPENTTVVLLPNVMLSGSLRFPRAGFVVMPVRAPSGVLLELFVDVEARTFRLDPDGPPEPLATLPDRPELALPAPQPPVFHSAPRRGPPTRGNSPPAGISATLGCLIFVACGVWMSLSATAITDRIVGGIGTLFFATAAAVLVRARHARSRQQQSLGQKGAAPAPQPAGPGHQIWQRYGAYLPLIAAAVEVPWAILMTMGLLFAVGDTPFEPTESTRHLWRAIAAIPPSTGLAAALVALLRRWLIGPVQRLFFALGVVACGGLILAIFHGVLD